jgi:CDGSH-type Zn-finger protein
LCEASKLTVIRLPHAKSRCQIKRNDMNDAVNAQKAPMPVEVEEGKHYFWCACGKSAKQPFCDGSHKDTGISPVKYTAEASKKVFFCGCKQSAKAPLCDGTHSKL